MNVEVVQRRLWEQSQQHRKHSTTRWIAASCDRVLKRSSNQDSLESRMLGNLHVRFGVGAGVRFPGPHHVSKEICFDASVARPMQIRSFGVASSEFGTRF